jgi:hypothetical protein
VLASAQVSFSLTTRRRLCRKLTLASSKVSLNVFSLSPLIPLTMLGALMLKKGKPSSCWSVRARRIGDKLDLLRLST